MFKHLRIKEETHTKYLVAKGLLASKGKFISLDDIADIAIEMFMKKIEEDNK